jgi:hypothetical protein
MFPGGRLGRSLGSAEWLAQLCLWSQAKFASHLLFHDDNYRAQIRRLVFGSFFGWVTGLNSSVGAEFI